MPKSFEAQRVGWVTDETHRTFELWRTNTDQLLQVGPGVGEDAHATICRELKWPEGGASELAVILGRRGLRFEADAAPEPETVGSDSSTD